MEFLVTQHNNVCVLSPQGSIDALTVTECAGFFTNQINQGRFHLLVDLGGVDFMSSAGLRLLLQAAKHARQKGGDLRLAGAASALEKMLKLSGFTSILKVFSTVDQAVASYAA
jgi:anti-sigma B factor antagonist